MKLSKLSPKGTSDWLPDEFVARKHIFDTWRKVCVSFGYLEYLTPLVEYADIYRAKSGEDAGGKELTLIDEEGTLALRPEMTPGVTRMVTRMYNDTPKPIKLFSIANFWRKEKPQRGRNREFWQLNIDAFGEDSLEADVEILIIALEVMKAFGARDNSFTLKINSRLLIDAVLGQIAELTPDKRTALVRTLDKYSKLTREEIDRRFTEIGLSSEQIENIHYFVGADTVEKLLQKFPAISQNQGFIDVNNIISSLAAKGYTQNITFAPDLIRGFDYYTNMVFEVFDNHPENKRSMFGGGRYNGLAELFGAENISAVGCAPGDETTYLFLQSWGLLPNKQSDIYYLPLLSEDLKGACFKLACKLRAEGKHVDMGLSPEKMRRALEIANKKEVSHVILLGENEREAGEYILKDMKTGEQLNLPLN